MYAEAARPDAVAHLRGGDEAPRIWGEVKFYQTRSGVLVIADVSGLPEGDGDGFFALHIHEGDSCGGEGFADTKGHYNPTGALHPYHAGDLPPLLSCGGRAYLAVRTDRFRVRDVIDRTVVIHSGADDFRTQPAGNAGAKIACGTIQKS